MNITVPKKELTFMLMASVASFNENTFITEEFEDKGNKKVDIVEYIQMRIKEYNEIYLEGNTSPVKMSVEVIGLSSKWFYRFTVANLHIDSDFYFKNRLHFLRYLGGMFSSLGLKTNLNAMQGALLFKDEILYFDGVYREMSVPSALSASVCNTCNFEFCRMFNYLSLREEVVDAEKRDTINN